MHDLFTMETFSLALSNARLFSERLMAVGKVSACLSSRAALLYTPL